MLEYRTLKPYVTKFVIWNGANLGEVVSVCGAPVSDNGDGTLDIYGQVVPTGSRIDYYGNFYSTAYLDSGSQVVDPTSLPASYVLSA